MNILIKVILKLSMRASPIFRPLASVNSDARSVHAADRRARENIVLIYHNLSVDFFFLDSVIPMWKRWCEWS